jgi:hypothetical protein
MQEHKIQEIYSCADNLLNKHCTKPTGFSSLEGLASRPLELNESIKTDTATWLYSLSPKIRKKKK